MRAKKARQMNLRRLFFLGTLSLAALTAGCSSCEPTPVPFQSEAGHSETNAQQNTPAATPSFAAVDGNDLPEGTQTFSVEGSAVTVPGRSVRSVLPIDLDRDGDRDAVLVAVDAQGAAALLVASREGTSFRAATQLGAMPTTTPGCMVNRYALRHFSAHFVLATLTETCPEGTMAMPQPYVIVSVGGTPSIRERFTLIASTREGAERAQISFRAEDKDGDQNEDLLVDVQITPVDLPDAAPLTLTYFDRPSGLARDTHEPEATLLRLMAETRARAHRNDAAFAAAAARRVAALHSTICRESGESRLRVGDAIGLVCGASAAAGSAGVTLVKIAAASNSAREALTVAERLANPGYTLTRADRTALDAAMAQLHSDEDVRLITGPSVSVVAPTEARLSALAFSADGRSILVRGTSPLTFDLETQTASAADAGAEDIRIYDVSHTFSIADIHRNCEGYALGIVRGDGLAVGAVADALIFPAPPPQGAACPLSRALRQDDGDFIVLGWAPQGVVVTRDDKTYVVPIGENGQPLGPASQLAQGMPAPAPLTPGAVSANGHAYVTASSIGFFVTIAAPIARRLFLRPSEWSSLPGEVSAAAVSEDAMQVAFVKGGKLYVFTRQSAGETH
jgi:hypothetical protein